MVMVSHGKRFVFLKTRKTAGTSLEMLMEPFCAPPGHVVQEPTPERITPHGVVGSRMQGRANRGQWHNHMPAALVRDALGAETFDAYRKITSVRDPFDRMVSWFHFKKRDAQRKPRTREEIRAAFRRKVLTGNWPNDWEVVSLNDRFLPDHVIRFERLHDDVAALIAALDLGIRTDALPHTKPTGSQRMGLSVADHYDDDTLGLVRTRFAWVFDRFGYRPAPEGYTGATA